MDNLFKLESTELEQELENSLNNLFNLTEDCPKSAANEDIRNLLFQTNFQENEIKELLTSKGYEDEKINCFITIFNERKNELMLSALNGHNRSYGETMTSFDWALKLSHGTNELCTMRYPLLQLCLFTSRNGELSQKTFDVTKDNLAQLILALESVDVSE